MKNVDMERLVTSQEVDNAALVTRESYSLGYSHYNPYNALLSACD